MLEISLTTGGERERKKKSDGVVARLPFSLTERDGASAALDKLRRTGKQRRAAARGLRS